MTQTPVVNRSVPLLPELQHRGGVPPVLVEQSIAEHGELREDVQRAVEDREEEEEPDDERRQGAAEDAIDDVRRCVTENGIHELHHDDVHECKSHAHVKCSAENVPQTNPLRPGIVQFVEKGWRNTTSNRPSVST